MANWETSIKRLLEEEGGFAAQDNKNGAVNFGITQKTYNSLKYPGSSKHNFSWPEEVKDLTIPLAKVFYYHEFWLPSGASKIISDRLAFTLFTLSVNIGLGRPTRWLQYLVGTTPDGVFGPKTESAVNSYPYGEDTLLKYFKKKAETYYRTLAHDNPQWYADDLSGWLKRLEKL